MDMGYGLDELKREWDLDTAIFKNAQTDALFIYYCYGTERKKKYGLFNETLIFLIRRPLNIFYKIINNIFLIFTDKSLHQFVL